MKFCGACGTPLQEGPDASGYPHRFCPACGWTWYDPPVPVTLVLVTTPDRRVVYCRKRSFPQGRWSVVSGFIPRGERAEETALREVREETGLEGKLIRKLGDIGYSYRDKNQDRELVRIYKRVNFYLLRYVRGDVRDHDHEADDARWFPIEQAIKQLKFATERKMVHRALAMLTARQRQQRPPGAQGSS